MQTQKNVKFQFLDDYEKIIIKLNSKLPIDPLLTLPQGLYDYVIYCDTTRVGVGCIFMQKGKVITYNFRQLKVHDKNYPTGEFDLATEIFALNIQRHYVLFVTQRYSQTI